MSDLVKRVRRIGIGSELGATTRDRTTAQEAADRIEQLETAFGELMKAWEFWQSQETKNGFSELCAAYWDAKAVLFRGKKMSDDNFYKAMKAKPLLDRLEWAAFKMCQRGHREDFASDVMTEAKARIETLEAALSHIYAWYPISVTQPHQTIDDMREFARAALFREKKDV